MAVVAEDEDEDADADEEHDQEKKTRVLDIVPGVPPSLAQPEILGVSLVPLATPELPDLHGEESGGHHRTPCESPRV